MKRDGKMASSIRIVVEVFIVSLLFPVYCICESTKYLPEWSSLDDRKLPQWYDDAKIGIFLHWGVFSVPSYGPGSAWLWWYWLSSKSEPFVKFLGDNYPPGMRYADFGKEFTAELWDLDHWCEVFSASGARYVVLTSKHHEGFTLWPSKVSWNWNAKDVGPKRDLLGDLATAIRNNTNIRFGVYHSMFEWFNPLYLLDKKNDYKTQYFVNTKTLPELLELVNIYKPEVIWSDGDWEAPDTYWKSTEFLAWLYNESPVKDTVVVNDRWGKDIPCKHGGYFTCTDRYNPKTLQKHKWENAMTIDKGSWGYRRNVQLSDFLTIKELIQTLIETVSCNGNLLINIGPTHDGRIIPIFEERLRQLGQWLKINQAAIYSSKPWTYQNDTLTPGVWYTTNKNLVYAMLTDWPEQGSLKLGSIQLDEYSTVRLLGWSQTLEFETTADKVTVITFPDVSPGQALSNWAWTLSFEGGAPT